MCDDLVTFVLFYHASQLLCNVRQHDLSKSPPNPLLGSVIETYVIGLYAIR